MKPFHAGLLMIAAALAGGLVVKVAERQALRASQLHHLAQKPTGAAPWSTAAQTAVETPGARVEPEKPSPLVSVSKTNGQKAKTNPIEGAPLPYQAPVDVAPPAPAEAPTTTVAAAPAASAAAPREPEALPIEAALVRRAEPPPPRSVTLRTGTSVPVRLDESLSSDRKMAGDTFAGSLADPIIADGLVIAERGSRVTGRVADARKAGRFGGTSMLKLELSSITTSDGQRIGIYTEPWMTQGESAGRGEAAKIGGGAALGAIIGAIAGGGKGAAIGAGVGGVAGTGAAAANGGKPVNVPAETVIPFRLASVVTITERQW